MSVNNKSHGIMVGGEALFAPTDRTEDGIDNYLHSYVGGSRSESGRGKSMIWGLIFLIGIAAWLYNQIS
jgi:hypothetical protein